MKKYLIRVNTKRNGYIIFTEFKDSLQEAECAVKNRMVAAGWGYMLTTEVKERYTGRIGLR